MTRENWIVIAFGLLLIFLSYGCKEETFEPSNPIEEKYLNNYISPENKWGFMNTDGEIIINPIYDDLKDFKEGLSAANLKGKWGFIDKQNNAVIPFDYKQVYSFSENRTFAQDFNNKWHLIDSRGQIISQLKFNKFSAFKNGYAVVGELGGFTLIDTNAEEVLTEAYKSINILNESNIIAKSANNKYGLLTALGDTILPFEYDRISGSLPHLICQKTDGQHYYNTITKKRSETFEKAFPFESDKSLIRTNDMYFLINTEYERLSQIRENYVSPVGSGYYQYRTDRLFGLLDKDGSRLTPTEFSALHRFNEDRIVFMKGEMFGYLDNSGQQIVPAQLYLAWDFINGYARIIGQRVVGYIDVNGQIALRESIL